MQPDIPSALLDIALAARRITEFASRYDRASMAASWELESAVERQMILLGEAVKRLPADFRESHAAIRWSAIAGLRDVLVHQYDRIDSDQIWQIATESIPGLLAYIEPLLPEEPRE